MTDPTEAEQVMRWYREADDRRAALQRENERLRREIEGLNHALDMERRSFPSNGIFLVDDDGRGRSYARIAKLGEVPEPIDFAAFARHTDAIARAVVQLRDSVRAEPWGDGLRWIGPSAVDYAEAIVQAVYAAERSVS